MVEKHRYVPMLKGKDGEYGALGSLKQTTKQLITPLIELPPIPWDFDDEAPAKTIDQHVSKVAKKIESNWGTARPIFLDFTGIPLEGRMSNGAHPVTATMADARSRGVLALPV